MPDIEKEARDRLIDAARTDVTFVAEGQTAVPNALDRLGRQAYGDATRLREAAEQLRRRFPGAEAIPLLEAAADHVEEKGTSASSPAEAAHATQLSSPAVAWSD